MQVVWFIIAFLGAAEVERIAPLATATVGDWAVYETADGAQRVEVKHKTLLLAEVEVRTVVQGRPVGLPAVRELRQTFDYGLDAWGAEEKIGEPRVTYETVEAAGRRWRCRLTVMQWRSGGGTCERRVWMSDEAPVYGLVKSEVSVDGALRMRMTLKEYRCHEGAPTTTQASP
jgi:hypothetical protein